MANNSKSSKVIIIAGMHRSGTSLTAGLLQTAGLNVGEDLIPAADDNQIGFFEDRDFEEFQDGVLLSRGLNYLVTSPERITLSDKEVESARMLISARAVIQLWGWKDPRTTLFLEFWNKELPGASFLFLYRHPLEVVFSLLRRGGPKVIKDPARLFKVWDLYNRRVLEFVRRHPEKSTLCHIHGVLQDREKFSELLSTRIGLPKSPDFKKRYKEGMLQHLYIPDWLTAYLTNEYPDTVSIYNELQGLAQIPYDDSPGSVNVKEEELGFVTEAMKVVMQVHAKMSNLAKLELTYVSQDGPSIEELNGMDKIQLIQEYGIIRNEYDKLVHSKALVFDRRLKQYPSLNRLASTAYETAVKTRNFIKKQRTGGAEQRQSDVAYDLSRDTAWAHKDTRFDRVLHVFFEETAGPRSAAGYLPGHKLCLPMSRSLEKPDYGYILEKCASDKINTIVLHTIWRGTREAIKVLRREISPVRVLAVWHGNTAQFVEEMVRRTFADLLRLKQDGLIDNVATVKAGLELLSGDIYKMPMYNLPPKVEVSRGGVTGAHKSVLIPLRDIWRKNFYTNMYAAGCLDELEAIYTNVLFVKPKEIEIKPEIRYYGKLGMSPKDEMFEFFTKVDAVMNVTLSECQPMVFLESLAYRVPCLTGPIQLDHLDGHPYRKLTEVDRADSLTDVSKALRKLLHLRWERNDELLDMMEEYDGMLCSAAISNYVAFLGL